eukprot:scaffold562_cov227-Pinguiococcus_pyrenoidosus.AAC.3
MGRIWEVSIDCFSCASCDQAAVDPRWMVHSGEMKGSGAAGAPFQASTRPFRFPTCISSSLLGLAQGRLMMRAPRPSSKAVGCTRQPSPSRF